MEMVHFIPPSQRRLAMLAAQADSAPVLIYGGSGTGKGAIARWIHANGPRSAKPVISAIAGKPLAQQIPNAQGGTFIITEIGSWPLGEQKTLLGFLNTRSLPLPAGGASVASILNVRIMVTTAQALEGRAQAGLFNAELLEKLNVFRLEMPPLARRTEEFEDIVLGITGEITREIHKEHLRQLEPDAWKRLKAHDWPGNLRELRNVLRAAILRAQGDQIAAADLPEFGSSQIDFHSTREEFEKIYILELLKTFGGEIDRMCEMTRLDKGMLLSKIQKYGIDLKDL